VPISGDDIVLPPNKLIDVSQAYFWTPAWQAAEQEADQDIAAGRIRELDNVDDPITSLREAREAKA
jgi:hypothetical protein